MPVTEEVLVGVGAGSMGLIVVGVDLAGPANAADTALAWFSAEGSKLSYVDSFIGASDAEIVRIIAGLSTENRVVVGLDAPLSYNDGGGDRPSDKSLRQAIVAAGMSTGSVMTPTFARMAFLTLRGLGVARALQLAGLRADAIVEVHPGAAFALNGAPIQWVRGFKANASSRALLVQWLREVNIHGVPQSLDQACHLTAAGGAALAARNWMMNTTKWLWRAIPRHHPFDFAC